MEIDGIEEKKKKRMKKNDKTPRHYKQNGKC